MIAGMVSMFACSSNTATTEPAVDSTTIVDTNAVVDTTAVDTTVAAQ